MAEEKKAATVEAAPKPKIIPRAKFKSGDQIDYPAKPKEGVPEAGTGTICLPIPYDEELGFTYKVQCDKAKNELPPIFLESELKPGIGHK